MGRAGLYRRQVEFLLPDIPGEDGVGGWTSVLEPAAPFMVWARVEELKPYQLVALGKELDVQGFKITTRFHTSLLGCEQVRIAGQQMRITAKQGDERRTEIIFYALNAR